MYLFTVLLVWLSFFFSKNCTFSSSSSSFLLSFFFFVSSSPSYFIYLFIYFFLGSKQRFMWLMDLLAVKQYSTASSCCRVLLQIHSWLDGHCCSWSTNRIYQTHWVQRRCVHVFYSVFLRVLFCMLLNFLFTPFFFPFFLLLPPPPPPPLPLSLFSLFTLFSIFHQKKKGASHDHSGLSATPSCCCCEHQKCRAAESRIWAVCQHLHWWRNNNNAIVIM